MLYQGLTEVGGPADRLPLTLLEFVIHLEQKLGRAQQLTIRYFHVGSKG
jgi:hypothetical protein